MFLDYPGLIMSATAWIRQGCLKYRTNQLGHPPSALQQLLHTAAASKSTSESRWANFPPAATAAPPPDVGGRHTHLLAAAADDDSGHALEV